MKPLYSTFILHYKETWTRQMNEKQRSQCQFHYICNCTISVRMRTYYLRPALYMCVYAFIYYAVYNINVVNSGTLTVSHLEV